MVNANSPNFAGRAVTMCSTMQQRSSARKHVLLASMHKKDAEVGSIHSSAADGQQYEKMPQKWKPKRPREVAGRKVGRCQSVTADWD